MDTLNTRQLEAVQHIEGPLLVLAGAGSGKTRVVTHRIVHLLEMGVPASEIVAVTFTNKAASEMQKRVLHLTQRSVLTSTFHSLCARILRESITHLGYPREFTIYDEEDSTTALKLAISGLDMKLDKGIVKQYRSQISSAKNGLIDPEFFVQEDPDFFAIYSAYQQRLKACGAVDFDDLLFLAVKLFKEHPDILESYQNRWSFILIDEYQDTNAAQYLLVKLLAQKHANVFAVGDPDQSIYSWRGANVQNILNFSKDFPGAKVIALEQNYRSRSNILQAANALVSHNEGRLEKNLWSEKGEGEKIGFFLAESDRLEVDFVLRQLYRLRTEMGVSLSECAIFYRTHSQSRLFEDGLLKERVPYIIVGGISFYQRREVKDILAWLKMVASSQDAIAFARTLPILKAGIGKTTLEKLQSLSHEQGKAIFDVCSSQLPFKLSARQQTGLEQYVQIILSLRESLNRQIPFSELISEVIEKVGYLDYLKEDKESYEERRENVAELLSKAAEWEEEEPQGTLIQFLEELALKSGADVGHDTQPQVKLMTLHNAKGLEFTAAFLVGMEEDLFPHINSLDSPEAIEEERRLCYVGMTRAKEFLFLTASSYRYLWGMPKMMKPSRFLSEVPREFLHAYHGSDFEEFSEEGFEEGSHVYHRDFGLGVVQRAYHTSLGETYDVLFHKSDQMRSLVAKFAKLTKAP